MVESSRIFKFLAGLMLSLMKFGVESLVDNLSFFKVKCSLKCIVGKANRMLCLGRSSLDLWKTQPYWALQ